MVLDCLKYFLLLAKWVWMYVRSDVIIFFCNDSKSKWKALNRTVQPNRKLTTIKIGAYNTEITNPTEIANKFIDYFSHVTDKLMNNIPPTTISPLANMNRLCNTFTFFRLMQKKLIS